MSNYNNSYSTIPMAEARGLRAVKPSVIKAILSIHMATLTTNAAIRNGKSIGSDLHLPSYIVC